MGECDIGGSCPVCNAPPEPQCFYCGNDGVEGDYIWVDTRDEFACKECQSVDD